jgi:ATP-dependent phosphoenolpyruvate carboxykinase
VRICHARWVRYWSTGSFQTGRTVTSDEEFDMKESAHVPAHHLEEIGIEHVNNVYWTLSTPALYEHIVRRNEGRIAHLGPLVVRTGHHTGRSPNDKFIVREPESE